MRRGAQTAANKYFQWLFRALTVRAEHDFRLLFHFLLASRQRSRVSSRIYPIRPLDAGYVTKRSSPREIVAEALIDGIRISRASAISAIIQARNGKAEKALACPHAKSLMEFIENCLRPLSANRGTLLSKLSASRRQIAPRYLPYRDEYHGEYQVLSKQRHDQRRRRDDLDDQQEEHVEADENRDGERNLKWRNVCLDKLTLACTSSPGKSMGVVSRKARLFLVIYVNTGGKKRKCIYKDRAIEDNGWGGLRSDSFTTLREMCPLTYDVFEPVRGGQVKGRRIVGQKIRIYDSYKECTKEREE